MIRNLLIRAVLLLQATVACALLQWPGDAAAQGSDFEVLENLRRLAYAEHVDEPKQLGLWREEAAT